ncbi:MAG TPA: 5'-nucleotidase [Bacteroidaceae bacterium]|nr:5'-nucleotidase [Bacteroidaceae bacterium]
MTRRVVRCGVIVCIALFGVFIGCSTTKENTFTDDEAITDSIPDAGGDSDEGGGEATVQYSLIGISNKVHAMDVSLESNADQTTISLLQPYKEEIAKKMDEVIGYASTTLTREAPESPLGNLVADVLREAGEVALGKPADMGLVNRGGLRSNLYAGNITSRKVYEIFPFENSLCVVTLKGSVLMELMRNITSTNGSGVSNCVIQMDSRRNLVSATIGGQAIDSQKMYSVATIDYLVEGNSGMTALTKAENVDAFSSLTLRQLMIDYIQNKTKAGQKITAQVEGRIKQIN